MVWSFWLLCVVFDGGCYCCCFGGVVVVVVVVIAVVSRIAVVVFFVVVVGIVLVVVLRWYYCCDRKTRGSNPVCVRSTRTYGEMLCCLAVGVPIPPCIYIYMHA